VSPDALTHFAVFAWLGLSLLAIPLLRRLAERHSPRLVFLAACVASAAVVEGCYMISAPLHPSLLVKPGTGAAEAARFLAPLAGYRFQPDVFTTRRRLETLESVLADVRQLILVPPALRARTHFYQGLDASSALSPALAR